MKSQIETSSAVDSGPENGVENKTSESVYYLIAMKRENSTRGGLDQGNPGPSIVCAYEQHNGWRHEDMAPSSYRLGNEGVHRAEDRAEESRVDPSKGRQS